MSRSDILYGLALPSPLRPNSYAGLELASELAGRTPALVGCFGSWVNTTGDLQPFPKQMFSYIRNTGAIPVFCWQVRSTSVVITPQRILSGEFDQYITLWAIDAKSFGGQLLVRMLHEFDGDWYPWTLGYNGWTPETHKLVWAYIVAIFRAVGATNVEFVWCPNRVDADNELAIRSSFPGQELVDVFGVDGYDFGNDAYGHKRLSWEQIFDRTLLPGALADEIAPELPKLVCELGTVEDPIDPLVKARSIAHWTGYVAKDRYNLMGWCWMNDREEDGAGRDNTFNSSPASQAAFREGVALNAYRGANA